MGWVGDEESADGQHDIIGRLKGLSVYVYFTCPFNMKDHLENHSFGKLLLLLSGLKAAAI